MPKLIPAFLPIYEGNYTHNYIHGGRVSGKSQGISDLLITKSREENEKILCTREIQKSIKESVYSLLTKRITEMDYLDEYNILKTEIEHCSGSRFVFSGLQDHTIQTIKSFEGVKYCWVEEAQSASVKSLKILIPTLRIPGIRFFYTYNRTKERDPVHAEALKRLRGAEAQNKKCVIRGVEYKWVQWVKDDTIMIYINYDGNPYMPDVSRKEMETEKENDYDAYLHSWLGMPEQQGNKAVLSRKAVLDAMSREVTDEGGYMIGCDVARFGDDRTVIVLRKGMKTIDYQILKKHDTVQVSEAIIEMIDGKECRINIDDTGVGGGVSDNLMHKGYDVNMVNFGANAIDNDKYANTISEMWFEFRAIIGEVQLPDDNTLLEELTDRYYSFDNKERKKIESKDDYKKRNNKSPDLADGFLLAYFSKSHEPHIWVL